MNLSPEISATALTAALTGVMWVPIILNRLGEMGIWKALSNPEPDVRPHSSWAYRLGAAHRNAIENLVVFAPLALCVHILGLSSPLTAAACSIFFWSRVAHAGIYTLGIPLLRTLAFVAGFAAQAVLFLRLMGAV